jgi:signal peptide peptidase SppA
MSCASKHFGPWAIEPEWFRKSVEMVNAGLWQMRSYEDLEAAERAAPTRVAPEADGIVRLQISGPMMKGESKFGGCNTLALRRQVQTARQDPAAKALLLEIDSPGGMVGGTDALAREVALASRVKPTAAVIDGIGASAAYWVASQCQYVFASRTSEVGSIGVVTYIVDSSAADEKKGYKVHVVSTGPMKGAFVPGTVVTEEMLQDVQRRVDDTNRFFLAALESGRKKHYDKNAEEWKSGKVWIASKAQEMGLIDGIEESEESGARKTLLQRISQLKSRL